MAQLDVLQKLLEEDKTNASLWYLAGVEYTLRGDSTNALTAFSQALEYGNDELKQKIVLQLQELSSLPEQSQKHEKMLMERKPQNDGNHETKVDEPIYTHGPMRVISGGKEVNQPKEKDAQKRVSFEEVGGLSDVKEAIRMKIIKPFMSPGLFERFNKKIGGGILLYGPPGCGKTFIAKATAGECNARFVGVHITDILDPYIGVSEQNLHDVFSSARAGAPCILFFDEVDTLGYHRGKSSSHNLRGIIDQLLVEIDGIDTSTQQILIVGATNMPWDVDPAFKRPGRFDKMLFVPPPDEEARRVIFELKLRNKPTESIDYQMLANITDLYSGADIENVVEVATENVISEIMKTGVERPLKTSDLRAAVSHTKPSTVEWLRTVKNYVRYANQSRQYDDVQTFLAKYKQI